MRETPGRYFDGHTGVWPIRHARPDGQVSKVRKTRERSCRPSGQLARVQLKLTEPHEVSETLILHRAEGSDCGVTRYEQRDGVLGRDGREICGVYLAIDGSKRASQQHLVTMTVPNLPRAVVWRIIVELRTRRRVAVVVLSAHRVQQRYDYENSKKHAHTRGVDGAAVVVTRRPNA